MPDKCDKIRFDKDIRQYVCKRDGYEGIPCDGNVGLCKIPNERRQREARLTQIGSGGLRVFSSPSSTEYPTYPRI